MKYFHLIVFLFFPFLLHADEIQYRIIFIIHGDNDYTFHDTDGNKFYSDEVILNKTIKIAGEISNSEFLIFHQKKRENFLFFFSKDDGEFFHFKNGNLISEKTYSRNDSEGWISEREIINSTINKNEKVINLFFYYGHEIPVKTESIYHSSYNDKNFDIYLVKNDLEKICENLSIQKFDLLVLSTCNNGKYETLSLLSSIASKIIASPEDLHLSMMNPEYLLNINSFNLNNLNEFYHNFAEFIFENLTNKTNTVVSILLFDAENPHLTARGEIIGQENFFYRPPLFGQVKNSE